MQQSIYKGLAPGSITAQDVYDRTCTHFATQKARAFDGMCYYRVDRTGLQCAAGAWIDDHEYSLDLEGKDCDQDYVRSALRGSGFPAAQIPLLRALQRAHDASVHADVLRGRLCEIANAYHLIPGAERAITIWNA